MRYAEQQLTRPKAEGGCDYGAGRRSVLARNGDKELIRTAGHKTWSGNGSPWGYRPSTLSTWDGSARDWRQKDIHEGRVTAADWKRLAPAVWGHLEVEFDIDLIDLRRTLLLDAPPVPGGLDPLPKAERKASPKVNSDRLYRVREHDGDLRMATYAVVGQKAGRVTVHRLDVSVIGEQSFGVKSLAEGGFAESPEGAKALWVETYCQDVREAEAQLEEARGRLERRRELLDWAESAIRTI